MALNSNTFHDMISNIDYSKLKKAPRKEEEETDEKDWTGVRKLFNSDYFKDGLNKAYNPNVKKVQYSGRASPNTNWSRFEGGFSGYPSTSMIGGMMGGVYPGAGSGYINPNFAGPSASAAAKALTGAAVGSAIINGAVNNATNNSKDYNKLGPDGYTPGESNRLFPEATPTRPTRNTIPGTEVKTPSTSMPKEEPKKNETEFPEDLGLEPDEIKLLEELGIDINLLRGLPSNRDWNYQDVLRKLLSTSDGKAAMPGGLLPEDPDPDEDEEKKKEKEKNKTRTERYKEEKSHDVEKENENADKLAKERLTDEQYKKLRRIAEKIADKRNAKKAKSKSDLDTPQRVQAKEGLGRYGEELEISRSKTPHANRSEAAAERLNERPLEKEQIIPEWSSLLHPGL